MADFSPFIGISRAPKKLQANHHSNIRSVLSCSICDEPSSEGCGGVLYILYLLWTAISSKHANSLGPPLAGCRHLGRHKALAAIYVAQPNL